MDQNSKTEKRLTVLEAIASTTDVSSLSLVAIRRARFNAKALTRQFDAQCSFQLADVSGKIEILLTDHLAASAVSNLRDLIASIRTGSA